MDDKTPERVIATFPALIDEAKRWALLHRRQSQHSGDSHDIAAQEYESIAAVGEMHAAIRQVNLTALADLLERFKEARRAFLWP
jgi:hypothetical protein